VRRAARIAIALVALAACGKKAAPDAPPQQPTAEDCRAAAANVALITHAPPGDADADLAECLKLPRAAVTCLAEAKATANIDSCLRAQPRSRFGKGGTEPAEPIGAPEVTADDCRTAAAAAKKLRPEIKETEVDLVDECVRSATTGDVKCLIAATTAAEAKKCGLFGLE
jgi:hypothetical protein